ncbi:arylsulfatase [Roseiconus nitratireducens]|uniref:Arylsulfatase n=1 Tax=Roseiconus nitratireducens TaxID=2605748 RepID=A0A5M6DI77_9BACT|nr:arylsulfatase [Roseiconus nitratireducens]KAA5547278.1 arylsulfatase [Roseiconus nitratireducens]
MRIVRCIAAVLVCTQLHSRTLAADPTARPNVLILYADDLGYGDLSIQNPDSKIPTPNLDQLARSSMRFTDGHSSSGICTPSRYALLTGRYHWRDFHGIVGPMGASVFQPGRLTLAELFQRHGYTTACIGKWHLGWDWSAIRKPDAELQGDGKKRFFGPEAYDWSKSIPDGPLDHGFDAYFGDTVINFPPYAWIENDRLVKPPDTILDTDQWKPIKEGNWECRPGPMCSDWDPYQVLPTLAEKGVQYIRSHASAKQPFFLYFAFPSPHAPIIPNDRFDGKSQAGAYGDCVVETDDVAGRLLRALKDAGIDNDTIVFFSADNGPEHYAYQRDASFDHWSSFPFRGLKRDIYEGGHHVPFLIRWPGITKSGSVSEALVSQIDLFATFAEFLSADLPDDAAEDSHSLMPLLHGQSDSVRDSHVHNTRQGHYAFRQGNWVLIDTKSGYTSRRSEAWEKKHHYPPGDDARVQLYNLRNDIGQRENVADHHADRVAELQTELQRIRQQGHSAPRLSGTSESRDSGR